jgi:hypothetical protein
MSRAQDYWDHYQTSLSLQATANYFGVTEAAVRKVLKTAGYELRSPGRKPSGKSTQELTRDRVRRYRQRQRESS